MNPLKLMTKENVFFIHVTEVVLSLAVYCIRVSLLVYCFTRIGIKVVVLHCAGDCSVLAHCTDGVLLVAVRYSV